MSKRILIDDISGLMFGYEVKGYDFVESTFDEAIRKVEIFAHNGSSPKNSLELMKAKEIVAEFMALKGVA